MSIEGRVHDIALKGCEAVLNTHTCQFGDRIAPNLAEYKTHTSSGTSSIANVNLSWRAACRSRISRALEESDSWLGSKFAPPSWKNVVRRFMVSVSTCDS